MQRILGVRIVRWYSKFLYVVGALLVGHAVDALLDALHTPGLVSGLLNAAVTLASVILGARLFRGRDEPVEPPRAWWRMTARPRLSRVLGIIAAIDSASIVLISISAALGGERSVQLLDRLTYEEAAINAVLGAIIAFLYLNSAVRQGKLPVSAREPKLVRAAKPD
jgi:hypothetical protein